MATRMARCSLLPSTASLSSPSRGILIQRSESHTHTHTHTLSLSLSLSLFSSLSLSLNLSFPLSLSHPRLCEHQGSDIDHTGIRGQESVRSMERYHLSIGRGFERCLSCCASDSRGLGSMDSDATIREGKTGETLNNPNTLPTTTWI